MFTRIAVLCLSLVLAAGAGAQSKKRIDKAADLPRFSYKIDGRIEDMLRDDAKWKPFAAAVRSDLEGVLAQYDIADKATERQLLSELAQLDMLDGRYEAALVRAAQVKALEEKPADKLISGISTRAIVAGVRANPDRSSAAYRAAVAKALAAEVTPLPYDVVANEAKEIKAGAELLGEGRLIGNVREVLQPSVDKNGALSSDLAPQLVRIKYVLVYVLPLKQTLVDAWSGYLAAHRVERPDIWAARAVTLPPGAGYAPVKIAIWDSGVDTKLYPGLLASDQGKVPLIAFDRFANPATGELRAHSRRAEEQGAAAQVAAQGLLRPAVEYRQPRGERSEDVPVHAQAGRIQGGGRGNRSCRQLDARHPRRGDRRRGQSLCADRRSAASNSTGILCPIRARRASSRCATRRISKPTSISSSARVCAWST